MPRPAPRLPSLATTHRPFGLVLPTRSDGPPPRRARILPLRFAVTKGSPPLNRRLDLDVSSAETSASCPHELAPRSASCPPRSRRRSRRPAAFGEREARPAPSTPARPARVLCTGQSDVVSAVRHPSVIVRVPYVRAAPVMVRRARQLHRAVIVGRTDGAHRASHGSARPSGPTRRHGPTSLRRTPHLARSARPSHPPRRYGPTSPRPTPHLAGSARPVTSTAP
jgi:hypothetical protein